MTRPELEKKFDEAITQAMNRDKWTASGMQAYALIALAIAVRGLWPSERTDAPAPNLRDFMPPVNQGGG